MAKDSEPVDVNGTVLAKGDTVTTVSGSTTARICDISNEFDTFFVRLRPLHQPSAKGVWHAADRVLRLGAGANSGSGGSSNGQKKAPAARTPERKPEPAPQRSTKAVAERTRSAASGKTRSKRRARPIAKHR